VVDAPPTSSPAQASCAWNTVWLILKIILFVLLCLSESGPPRLVYQGF
jgi:hypothetical protein